MRPSHCLLNRFVKSNHLPTSYSKFTSLLKKLFNIKIVFWQLGCTHGKISLSKLLLPSTNSSGQESGSLSKKFGEEEELFN